MLKLKRNRLNVNIACLFPCSDIFPKTNDPMLKVRLKRLKPKNACSSFKCMFAVRCRDRIGS